MLKYCGRILIVVKYKWFLIFCMYKYIYNKSFKNLEKIVSILCMIFIIFFLLVVY